MKTLNFLFLGLALTAAALPGAAFSDESSNASGDEGFALCTLKMRNAGVYEFAQAFGRDIKTVKVLRMEMGGWTEAVGNNLGSAEIALAAGTKTRAYYQVYAEQIGTSSDCKITGVKKLETSEIDPVAVQAENYKLLMGDTQYYSESDEPWETFYSGTPVGQNFPLSEIKNVLHSGDLPVETWSHAEVLEFLDDQIKDNEMNDRKKVYAYQQFKAALLKDFAEVRGFKVGVPNSGAQNIYIVGRRKDGRLVGLQTVAVET